jgi:hypothetical protein
MTASLTPKQADEWAVRKGLARDFVRGAVVFGVRLGLTPEDARREVQAAVRDA